MVRLEEIETGHIVSPGMGDKYQDYVTAFNYSLEDIEKIIGEMAATGKEPIGSMGNDVPVVVLSKKPYRLFNYSSRCLHRSPTLPSIPSGNHDTQIMGLLQNLLDET
jgi:glutamate synthase (NADPH/NADH) large chain